MMSSSASLLAWSLLETLSSIDRDFHLDDRSFPNISVGLEEGSTSWGVTLAQKKNCLMMEYASSLPAVAIVRDGQVDSSCDFCTGDRGSMPRWGVLFLKWSTQLFLEYVKVSLWRHVRMAERSKAPDSSLKGFPLRSLLVHECGRGFESHFWQRFLFQKNKFFTI